MSTVRNASAEPFFALTALHETARPVARPSFGSPRAAVFPGAGGKPVGAVMKRLIDIAGASLAIIFFAPLMAIISILLLLDGGPVIFSHTRIGFQGRRFRCLKFRSMVVDAEERLGALLAADPFARAQWERNHKLDVDPRVTPLGRFLRATSIDELPQFFNVLVGDMSLVGPRPITEREIARYGNSYRHYRRCRPGVTGFWQVSGRNDVSYGKRVALDRRYAVRQSLICDFFIMLKTFKAVLERTGAR